MTSASQKVLDQMMLNMQRPTPEGLYHQLGRLRNEMPMWTELTKPSSGKWIGRVLAVVEAVGIDTTMEIVTLRGYFDHMHKHGSTEKLGMLIAQVIDTALAKLELKLPAEAQGAFIPAGGVFDGYQAVSKAAGAAQKAVLFVDPYADDTLISDFVALAPDGVPVFVLGDAHYSKPSLKPGAERWIAQWQGKRPLQVRLAPARSLHDRLLVVDGATTYVVGQSFKDLAKRAHSSLVRMDPDSGALKIEAHVGIWQSATAVA